MSARRPVAALLVVAGIATTALSGCGGQAVPPDPAVAIGSKGFTESRVIAAAYAQALARVGFTPRVRTVRGTLALARALRIGSVDMYPEYTGSAWTAVEGESPLALAGRTPAQQAQMVRTRLAADSAITAFPPAPGSNNVAAACTRASGIRSLADLAGRATPLALAGEAETFSRPDALPLVEKAYGFTTGRRVVTGAGDRYGPIARGEVDCVAAYATDPQINSLGLVIIRDPKRVLGGAIDYRPLALANGNWWRGLPADVQAQVDAAVANVSRKMTTAWLREANRRVTEDGERPEDVALELVNVSVPGRAAAPR